MDDIRSIVEAIQKFNRNHYQGCSTWALSPIECDCPTGLSKKLLPLIDKYQALLKINQETLRYHDLLVSDYIAGMKQIDILQRSVDELKVAVSDLQKSQACHC